MGRKLVFALGMGFVLASMAWSQTTNATLVGGVTDPQAGAVVGAVIVVKNTGTGVSRQVTTNELGTYRVFPLNPGTYEVTASAPGFKSKVAPGVVLEVASNVKVDFQLEVGQVTETVEVAATASILQTQEASVGGTVTGSELARLPVNGRNYTRLILLLPGTSDQGGSQSRGTFSGTQLISVNGQRRQDNNFTVDGVDNNFMMMNSPGASPPMDSIQEFRVLNNTSAEFGRSAGSNVNIAIKSGTRDLHGSMYEYLRNDKFDANDYFANRQGQGKVPFRQNQYGFTLGGPMIVPKLYNGREKTFWFINWEGFRRRRATTGISTTPIVEQRNGDFTQQPRTIYDPFTSVQQPNGTLLRQPFAGNRIPQGRISPAIKFFLDTMMPLPNQPGLNNNLLNTEGLRNDRDLWNIRADHTFNAKNNVFFRYSSQNVGEFNPNSNPNLYRIQRFDAVNYAGAWNHIFSPTTVLEVKFGYNNPQNPGQDYNRKITRGEFLDKTGIKLYQRDVFSDPIPSLSAIGEFGAGGGGDITYDKIYQWIANFSKVMGRHSVRFGANYSHRIFFTNTSNPMNGNGDFDRRLTSLATDSNSGHSFATMLLGTPTEIRRGTGNTTTDGRIHAHQYFVQDDFRVNSKLTINAGLRYEYANSPYDVTDRLGNLWVRRDATTGRYYGSLMWATTNPEIDPDTGQRNQPAKTLGFGRGLKRNNHTDFAPRIGLAYQVNSKTVLRSAFGIFFNSTFVQELQDMRKFWPFTVQQVFTANTGVIPDLLITGDGPAFSNTSAIGGWPQNPENRTPYSQQWNLTIQRQLMDDMTLDLGYVGSANKKQIGYNPINAATPGPGDVQPRRLMPAFGDLDGGANQYSSAYHSFRANAVKRFSRGLQFNANYTWGRAMDNTSSLAEYRTQNPYNLRQEWARSSIDLRHIFQLAYVYELPFGKGKKFGAGWNPAANLVLGGWSVEGITRAQTGAPVNVLLGQDRANVGRTYQRPDLRSNPNNGPKTPDQWFTTSSFQLPAIYTYGSAGAYVVEAMGRYNWDISLQKDFRVKEGHLLQFRSEFYNLPNSVSMGNPNSSYSSSAFGKVTSATAARQIQFGLRYAF
ncbi:MAG: carboxypeptidase regulatory-like domain-containing protein [Acidobacteria bacterium]|nr:carboxypeptidase regulatory-like domain-containing protein [Acidobacteriota bacterium]